MNLYHSFMIQEFLSIVVIFYIFLLVVVVVLMVAPPPSFIEIYSLFL